MRPATCHPDRQHAALGLCASCYQTRYRDKDSPGAAEQRERRRERRREFAARTEIAPRLPSRLSHLRQYATVQMPEVCAKCGSRVLKREGRRISCFTCGHDLFLVEAS